MGVSYRWAKFTAYVGLRLLIGWSGTLPNDTHCS